MKVFDWEKFWIDHPKQQMSIHNTKWANLRPPTYDYQKAFDEVNGILKFKKTDRVLEVGCGTGEMLPLLNKIVPLPQIAAVDFSGPMIEIARANHPQTLITKAPAHILPFFDNGFDKVYCSGVIQHIATPFFIPSIMEILRVTKIGGSILISDVLEKADPSAEVFTYPKEEWEQFSQWAGIHYSEAAFEKRLNVHLVKKKEVGSTLEMKQRVNWGDGTI